MRHSYVKSHIMISTNSKQKSHIPNKSQIHIKPPASSQTRIKRHNSSKTSRNLQSNEMGTEHCLQSKPKRPRKLRDCPRVTVPSIVSAKRTNNKEQNLKQKNSLPLSLSRGISSPLRRQQHSIQEA